jgi:hypothetical protein
VRLKLNGTQQLLAYADGVNLWKENISTVKSNIEVALDASEEIRLEVNAEKGIW